MLSKDDHEATERYFRQERREIAEMYRSLSPGKQMEFLDGLSDSERAKVQKALQENPE